jgi:hypothetical protein
MDRFRWSSDIKSDKAIWGSNKTDGDRTSLSAKSATSPTNTAQKGRRINQGHADNGRCWLSEADHGGCFTFC